MPMPVDMGPQPERSMVATEEAMRVVMQHQHIGRSESEVKQIEVFYPINNGAYLAAAFMCPVCDVEFENVMKEVVRIR